MKLSTEIIGDRIQITLEEYNPEYDRLPLLALIDNYKSSISRVYNRREGDKIIITITHEAKDPLFNKYLYKKSQEEILKELKELSAE